MANKPTTTQMIDSYKTIEKKVEFILEKYPQSRGDDTILIYRLLREFYPQVKLSFKNFKDLLYIPAFDSIRRSRQALTQLENKAKGIPAGRRTDLRPTKRVQKKRDRKEKGMRKLFSQRNATLEEFEA